MGGRVARLLESAGHQVVLASRSTGIDAYTGTGLADSFAGADAVVDCLNISLDEGRRLRRFLRDDRSKRDPGGRGRPRGTSRVRVDRERAQPRDQQTHGLLPRQGGAGSAIPKRPDSNHDRPYQHSGLNLRRHSSTRLRVGPLALVPRMMSQPVAADAVARVIVSVVELGRMHLPELSWRARNLGIWRSWHGWSHTTTPCFTMVVRIPGSLPSRCPESRS